MDIGIRKKDVIAFKQNIYEGMQICTPIGKATLLHKYPHIAETDKGQWNWNEIYLAEKGFICEDRKKLTREFQ